MPKLEENQFEILAMEKGNSSRHQTSGSRSSGSEVKNKQDSGPKYSRFPRYKDGASPRPDARRKSNPQRSREGFDKRPRTRSGAFCERYRNEVVDNIDARPFPRQGSKKVNLNHLLNFTLVPVDGRDSGLQRPIHTRLKLPKYNKELFLQANCQFVTRDDGNYAHHCQNPDVLIDWALIEEVRLPSYDIASCPICLYPPVAAKITRCGHVYCWSCILHYLAITDKSWQKCPICFEAITKSDLKSVVPIIQKQVVVGSEVVLCLMKREKGSMVPVPATFQSLSTCKISDDQSITRFQKLLLASKCEVREIIQREQSELEKQLMLEKDTLEASFIESALESLQEREINLEAIDVIKSASEGQKSDDNDNQAMDKHAHLNNENFSHYASSETVLNSNIDENEHAEISSCDNLHDNVTDVEHTCDSSKKENDSYYFYQAKDGQHIYLHNINVRMLVKEFGSLKDSPTVLKAKVVELENLSMTEVLRKRLRYLQHIPLTCEFQVAELDIHSFLSKVTVQEFNGEILKRRKLRSRKAREERKREKHIEEEENKKLGKFPGATYNLNSIDQFPVCISRKETDLREIGHLSSSPGNEGYEIEYPSVGISNLSLKNSPVIESSSPPTTFAQMLCAGQTSFNQAAAWTRKTVETKAISTLQTKDLSDDDHLPVPEYHQSFQDAFQVALDAVINKSEDNAGTSGSASKKRNKKAKNKVLFTTSMCRSK